jgi:hypothetical protein
MQVFEPHVTAMSSVSGLQNICIETSEQVTYLKITAREGRGQNLIVSFLFLPSVIV